jgi:flagellar FliL protein
MEGTMADAKVVDEAKTKSGPPLILIAVAMVVTVLGAIGGALYWLTRSGRLPVQAATASAAPATLKPEPPKTRLVELEPLLVNLADPSGGGYLRVVMVLRVDEEAPVKGEKPKEEKPPEKGKVVVNEDQAMLRDAALNVLSRETSDLLLAPDGKERLKKELRESFGVHVPTLKVEDVLFTEFLVQR